MATYTILSANAPYYTVLVEFGEQSFEQTLVSVKENEELGNQFQEYANTYETEWLALEINVPIDPELEV
jgi:hypothetical protein